MSSKHELTTLTTTITELRHRHTSAGSPDDDAGAALTKAEADVKAAQESLARLEAIDRGSNPAAWRTALVEFSQLVSGVAAGSVRDANTAADMRDASSTKGAKELLETTKGIMQHVMERNRKCVGGVGGGAVARPHGSWLWRAHSSRPGQGSCDYMHNDCGRHCFAG